MSQIIQSGFDGASLKVERAYRHIDELKAIVAQFSGSPTNTLTITKQSDGSETVNFASLGRAGQSIPLVIGDAVHNLRAAFDHLWLALHRATADTGRPTFPFHKTRVNLIDIVAKSPVKTAFPDTERLILDIIKPHRDSGGNEIVWAITHFDNIDKHNLTISSLGGPVIQMSNCTFEEVGAITSGTNIKYQDNGKISLDISIPEDNVLGGQPIIPTLLNMAQATGEAVDLFRKTFL